MVSVDFLKRYHDRTSNSVSLFQNIPSHAEIPDW